MVIKSVHMIKPVKMMGIFLLIQLAKIQRFSDFFTFRRFPGLSVLQLHLHFVFQFLLLLLFDQ